ncbi:TetR/AcrR family transcriptional regulator [Rhizobium sp. ARZ01]|uniref:TetR/AcrR family transcriptional regulator n=1 Tax=Rhizobium sp. ARZ01 TaxID=2769313 RepID=UPI0017859C40|nr:TetR/AcrR family transcriptional regulator [Rhizobium sp. ARZ01]MBD9375125.1 TetR/AcrR family transcriptional regulator [Rhizobium sp. ARZ01]
MIVDAGDLEQRLRRRPKQERSRERVEEILRVAKELIGEKGIDGMTMREVALLTGGPIASVYQYFPNKSAIIAMLYEQYSAETRAGIEASLSDVRELADIRDAADAILDGYYLRVAGDPAIQDLLNAIQADKELQNMDIVETRHQAELFCALSSHRLAQAERERFGRLVFLLFQLAGSMVRLAITLPADEAEMMLVDFKQIMHGQLASFRSAEAPELKAQESA